MALFKSEPNLNTSGKARVEFFLQRIAESVGLPRMQLPVVSLSNLQDLSSLPTQQIVDFVGKHLSHDVSGINVAINPEQPEQCGGGG